MNAIIIKRSNGKFFLGVEHDDGMFFVGRQGLRVSRDEVENAGQTVAEHLIDGQTYSTLRGAKIARAKLHPIG